MGRIWPDPSQVDAILNGLHRGSMVIVLKREIRERLTAIGEVAEPTDEQSAEVNTLTAREYSKLETRERALIVAGDEPAATGVDEDGEAREFGELEGRVSLRRGQVHWAHPATGAASAVSTDKYHHRQPGEALPCRTRGAPSYGPMPSAPTPDRDPSATVGAGAGHRAEVSALPPQTALSDVGAGRVVGSGGMLNKRCKQRPSSESLWER